MPGIAGLYHSIRGGSGWRGGFFLLFEVYPYSSM